MGKVFWAVILGVFLIFAIFMFANLPQKASNGLTDSIYNGAKTPQETKTFVLTGENFKFIMNGVTNPEIRVKEGDKVRIEFTSTSGTHNWVLDEFGATTQTVKSSDTNPSSFVEFTANKKGSFEYYCGIGSHRANGMKGNLIVE